MSLERHTYHTTSSATYSTSVESRKAIRRKNITYQRTIVRVSWLTSFTLSLSLSLSLALSYNKHTACLYGHHYICFIRHSSATVVPGCFRLSSGQQWSSRRACKKMRQAGCVHQQGKLRSGLGGRRSKFARILLSARDDSEFTSTNLHVPRHRQNV